MHCHSNLLFLPVLTILTHVKYQVEGFGTGCKLLGITLKVHTYTSPVCQYNMHSHSNLLSLPALPILTHVLAHTTNHVTDALTVMITNRVVIIIVALKPNFPQIAIRPLADNN